MQSWTTELLREIMTEELELEAGGVDTQIKSTKNGKVRELLQKFLENVYKNIDVKNHLFQEMKYTN